MGGIVCAIVLVLLAVLALVALSRHPPGGGNVVAPPLGIAALLSGAARTPAAPAAGVTPGGGVVAITSDAQLNTLLAQAAQQRGEVDLLVHSPGCGHCTTVMPVFQRWASSAAKPFSVTAATVDAQALPSVAQRYGVHGYPTLLRFSNELAPSPMSIVGADRIQEYLATGGGAAQTATAAPRSPPPLMPTPMMVGGAGSMANWW